MKSVAFLVVVMVALSGCSSTQVAGTGAFFNLTERNVVYRDLTRPVSVDNEPEKVSYAAPRQ